MNYFSEFIDQGAERIVDRVVWVNDAPIGLLRPSTVWGCDLDKLPIIYGPRCIAKAKTRSRDDFWQAMVESGAILFGAREDILHAKKFLEIDRLSRTASYLMAGAKNCRNFIDQISSIEKGRVLIIGCGGIGSLAALNLAGAGVNELLLVDGDFIESSNLNRQFMWSLADLGRKKVSVLRERIADRYPQVVCNTMAEFVGEDQLVDLAEPYDIVILTADNPLGLGRTLRFSGATKIIEGGYVNQYLAVSKSLFARNNEPTVSWQRSPGFIGPSFGPSNTEIAGMVASLALQSMGGGIDRDFELDTIWNSNDFPRKPL